MNLVGRVRADIVAVVAGNPCAHSGCVLDDNTGDSKCVACGVVVRTDSSARVDWSQSSTPITNDLTDAPWPHPWPRPISVYGVNGPNERTTYEVNDHTFVVSPTDHTALHTGRMRYHVACVTCELLLHLATTGPASLIESHLRSLA